MLRGSLDGRGVCGRMDTCIRMDENLCCAPETITTLLIGYTSKTIHCSCKINRSSKINWYAETLQKLLRPIFQCHTFSSRSFYLQCCRCPFLPLNLGISNTKFLEEESWGILLSNKKSLGSLIKLFTNHHSKMLHKVNLVILQYVSHQTLFK